VGFLLQSMSCPERDLALLTMLSDLSVAEICGLQWKYLNLANSSYKLEYEVIPPLTIAVRKQSYRGKLSHAIGSRKRFVRATPPLCSLLHQLKRRKQFMGPDDFVLASRTGTPVRPENIAARRLKALGKSFGMTWLSWSVFHRTGIKLRAELGRTFDEDIERLLAALSWLPT
jgi:site-specific recombinase XerC